MEFSFYQGISRSFNYTKITFITCFSAFWWRVLVFINLNNMFPKMNCLWCNQVSPQPPRSSKHVRRWKISYKRQNLRYCNANVKTLLFIQKALPIPCIVTAVFSLRHPVVLRVTLYRVAAKSVKKNPDQLKKVLRTLTQFLEINKGIKIIRHKSITKIKKIHDLHRRKSKLNIYLECAQGNYTNPCNIKS